MKTSNKITLAVLILVVLSKGGLGGTWILLLIDFCALTLCANYLLRNRKKLRFEKILLFVPILTIVISFIISLSNPSFRHLEKKDLIDLKLEDYLSKEEDVRKSLMISGDLRSIAEIHSYDPLLSLAIFLDLKNRFSDVFGENNVGYKFLSKIEDKLVIESSSYVPTIITLNNSLFLQNFHLICQLIFGLVIFFNFDHRREIRYALATLFIFGTLLAVLGIFQKINYFPSKHGKEIFGIWDAPEPRYFYSSFTYKNHWSAFAILSLMSGVALIGHFLKRKHHFSGFSPRIFIFIVLIIPLVVSIPHSGSRSGMLVLVVLFFFSIPILLKISPLKLNKSGLIILIIVICSVFITSFALSKNTTKEMISVSMQQLKDSKPPLRFLLWKDLIGQISQKTFWGFGYNSFQAINPKFQSIEVREMRSLGLGNAHRPYRPLIRYGHSDALQYLSEFGWLCFVILILPLVMIVLSGYFFSNSPTVRILCLGNLSFLAYCVFDFPTKSPACLIIFFTSLALTAKYSKLSENKSIETK